MGQQQCDVGRAFRRSPRRLHRSRQRQDAVRSGSLRRRRSSVAHTRARLHRIRLALAVHPQSPDPSASGGAHELCPGADDRRSAFVSRRPQAARGAKRDDHRLRLHAQDRAHRRHELCGRDEKIGVHRPQLPLAGETGHADALLGQHGRTTATRRSSSASPARARRRSPPIRNARSSATTSMGGGGAESSISRAAATPRRSSSRARPNRRSMRRPNASAPSWRT